MSALLQGKALDVYSRMSVDETSAYDKVKPALLKRYETTEDGYRVKFRTSQPEKSETPSQFASRISSYFTRWVELTGITQDYDGLVDLLVREQFLQCCPKEMATVLKEHSIKNLGELASLAEKYIEARGNNSFTNCVGKNNSRNPNQFEKSNHRQSYNATTDHKVERKDQKFGNNKLEQRRCLICNDLLHLADRCPNKGKFRKTANQGFTDVEGTNITASLQEQNCVESPAYSKQSDSNTSNETNHCCIIQKLEKCCMGKEGSIKLECGHEIIISNLKLDKDMLKDLPKNMPTCEGLLAGQKVSVKRDSGSSSGSKQFDFT